MQRILVHIRVLVSFMKHQQLRKRDRRVDRKNKL